MLGLSGFGHVSLTVSDLARSTAWYKDVLGFEELWGLERDGYVKAILNDPASGVVLSLTHHGERGSGDAFSEFRTGLDHLAFVVPSFAELEQWKARFESLGVKHSPIATTTTGAVIMFRDPDNVMLEIYAPRTEARSDESEAPQWAFKFPPVTDARSRH